MLEAYSITDEDIEAVLEGYSFGRTRWLLLFMAVGLFIALALFVGFYRLQTGEGGSLMEEFNLIMPIVTLAQAGLAIWLWQRDRAFAYRHWGEGIVDPTKVAALGWRSALRRTPAEVCVLLFEAYSTLRVGAWAFLALASMGVLVLGTTTSDLTRTPLWWINAAGFIYWWYLLFRSFPTPTRAKRWFHSRLSNDTGSVHVLAVADS